MKNKSPLRTRKIASDKALNARLKLSIPPSKAAREKCAITISSSLVPVRVCAIALGTSEEKVSEMIQDGTISWAFDLRRQEARRGFIFVLSQTLYELQTVFAQTGTVSFCGVKLKSNSLSWNEVIELILPNNKPVLNASELARAFSISSDHLMNLIRDGILVPLNVRRLRTTTPIISRDNIINFLKHRRL